MSQPFSPIFFTPPRRRERPPVVAYVIAALIVLISFMLIPSVAAAQAVIPNVNHTGTVEVSTLESGGGEEVHSYTGIARVVDGDTLEIDGQQVELHGIDAPELEQVCRVVIFSWPCGEDAQKMLSALVAKRDVVCDEIGTGGDGPPQAVCHTEGAQLNETMVRIGMALATKEYGSNYSIEELAAQAENIGVWRSRFDPPWEWRAENGHPGTKFRR